MKITLRKIEERNTEQVDYVKLENTISAAIAKVEKDRTERYSITREWMKFILYPMFWGIAIFSGIFTLGSFYLGGKTILTSCQGSIDLSGLIMGMTFFFIGLVLIAVCLSSYWSAKEIDKEKDRQYVASMFSNMVALVALIVAFVALFKG